MKVLTRDVDRARSKLLEPGLEFVRLQDWEDAIPGCSGVVNLAGEPIATRWNDDVKKQILDSRVSTTKRVVVSMGKPAMFVRRHHLQPVAAQPGIKMRNAQALWP